jgi:hypothetical protein
MVLYTINAYFTLGISIIYNKIAKKYRESLCKITDFFFLESIDKNCKKVYNKGTEAHKNSNLSTKGDLNMKEYVKPEFELVPLCMNENIAASGDGETDTDGIGYVVEDWETRSSGGISFD